MAWMPLQSSQNGKWSQGEILACENAAKINGWIFPKSKAEYWKLGSEQIHWLEVCHGEELEQLLNPVPEKKRHFERRENESDADAAARTLSEIVERFKKLHPQYIQNRANLLEVSRRRTELNIAIENYDYKTLCDIFIALCLEGLLEIDPSKIGLPYGPMTGKLLRDTIRTKPNAEKILDEWVAPTQVDEERERVQRMTSQEFEAQDETLRWAREQEKRQAKISAFELEVRAFMATTPDYVATPEHRDMILAWLEEKQLPMSTTNIRAAFTALTDSGKMQRDESRVARWNGSTLQVSDVEQSHVGSTDPIAVLSGSLKKRIRGMSADEYSLFLQNNPEIARKIDAAGA